MISAGNIPSIVLRAAQPLATGALGEAFFTCLNQQVAASALPNIVWESDPKRFIDNCIFGVSTYEDRNLWCQRAHDIVSRVSVQPISKLPPKIRAFMKAYEQGKFSDKPRKRRSKTFNPDKVVQGARVFFEQALADAMALGKEAWYLDAIKKDPDDVEMLLSYADWLQERGDPRGEFIQVEASLPDLYQRATDDDPRLGCAPPAFIPEDGVRFDFSPSKDKMPNSHPLIKEIVKRGLVKRIGNDDFRLRLIPERGKTGWRSDGSINSIKRVTVTFGDDVAYNDGRPLHISKDEILEMVKADTRSTYLAAIAKYAELRDTLERRLIQNVFRALKIPRSGRGLYRLNTAWKRGYLIGLYLFDLVSGSVNGPARNIQKEMLKWVLKSKESLFLQTLVISSIVPGTLKALLSEPEISSLRYLVINSGSISSDDITALADAEYLSKDCQVDIPSPYSLDLSAYDQERLRYLLVSRAIVTNTIAKGWE